MSQNGNLKENEVEAIEDWRNKHGNPDLAYLRSLAITGTPEAVGKLKSIAKDLDIELDPNATPDDIIDKIRMTVQKNRDGDSSDTN